MGLPKGRTNNYKGRPFGSKNKLRQPLVAEILDIAAELKNQNIGLRQQALLDPKWFCETFLKNMIPRNIDVTGSISIEDVLRSLADRRNGASGK